MIQQSPSEAAAQRAAPFISPPLPPAEMSQTPFPSSGKGTGSALQVKAFASVLNSHIVKHYHGAADINPYLADWKLLYGDFLKTLFVPQNAPTDAAFLRLRNGGGNPNCPKWERASVLEGTDGKYDLSFVSQELAVAFAVVSYNGALAMVHLRQTAKALQVMSPCVSVDLLLSMPLPLALRLFIVVYHIWSSNENATALIFDAQSVIEGRMQNLMKQSPVEPHGDPSQLPSHNLVSLPGGHCNVWSCPSQTRYTALELEEMKWLWLIYKLRILTACTELSQPFLIDSKGANGSPLAEECPKQLQATTEQFLRTLRITCPGFQDGQFGTCPVFQEGQFGTPHEGVTPEGFAAWIRSSEASALARWEARHGNVVECLPHIAKVTQLAPFHPFPPALEDFALAMHRLHQLGCLMQNSERPSLALQFFHLAFIESQKIANSEEKDALPLPAQARFLNTISGDRAAQVACSLGLQLLKRADYVNAQTCLHVALKAAPEDPKLLLRTAELLIHSFVGPRQRAQLSTAAIRLLQKAVAQFEQTAQQAVPDSALWRTLSRWRGFIYLNLSYVSLGVDDFFAALRYAQRAVATLPTTFPPVALIYAAEALVGLQRFRDAQSLLDMCAATARGGAKQLAAVVQRNKDALERAVTAFQAAAETHRPPPAPR
eukprot:Polyplicarium_translucidae@DN1440_c0_g1_i1.p1